MNLGPTNFHNHDVYHWLSPLHTRLWAFGGLVRRKLASHLGKRYPSGVGVVSETCRLIAYVSGSGAVRELMPPHRRIEAHQMANRYAVPECPCANYFDPESRGAWRDSGKSGHHPVCQFERVAQRVFTKAAHRATAIKPKDDRPDRLDLLKKEEL
jgi:hypothetical protein